MKAKVIYDPYEAIGGILCLDFVNTLGGNRKSTTIEYLHSYEDLVDWAHSVKIIDDSEKKNLLSSSKQNKIESMQVFHNAIQLRETLHRMITALKDNQSFSQEDLTLFNNELRESNSQRVLSFDHTGGKWIYFNNNDFKRVIWPIILSGAEVFTSNSYTLIRECENETCGWLFLDHTKNKNRRWCDMAICGNRVKQRNYQEKIRTNRT